MIVGVRPGGADRLGGRASSSCTSEPPLPRIGIHYGDALYRDGDYYGRDVNIASRVAARSAGGEVLVTRPVVERAGSHLEFERIAEVRAEGLQRVDRDLPRRAAAEEDGVSAPDRCEPSARARRSGPARRRAGRCVVLLSGGRDSTCLLDLAVTDRGPPTRSTALHVNYGLREAARRRRAPLRGAVRAARGGARGPPPAAAARPAISRPGRATSATAAAAQLALGARRRRGRRPHRDRPGRDDPLPAGLLAEPAGAAGDARRARACWCGRCCDSRARRPPRTAARAGSSWREDETQRSPTRTRAGGCARAGSGAARRSIPRRGDNVLALAEILRDEAAVLDALVDAGARRAAPRSSWRRLRELPPALRAARRPAAGGRGRRAARRRGPRGAPTRSRALPSTRTRRSTCPTACGRSPSGDAPFERSRRQTTGARASARP